MPQATRVFLLSAQGVLSSWWRQVPPRDKSGPSTRLASASSRGCRSSGSTSGCSPVSPEARLNCGARALAGRIGRRDGLVLGPSSERLFSTDVRSGGARRGGDEAGGQVGDALQGVVEQPSRLTDVDLGDVRDHRAQQGLHLELG